MALVKVTNAPEKPLVAVVAGGGGNKEVDSQPKT